jgi:rhamnogalacturonyl hydrolase YesR
MFTFAVAKGVNQGWIEPRYKTIAEEGWKGIETMINEKGQVNNICVGTGTSTAMIHYYKRPILLNDIHGLGAVLLAGIEVMKLPKEPEED